MSETISCTTEPASFEAPTLQFNADGWGPCELPELFTDIPYQPFSKSDRLGKISDWTGSATLDKKYSNKYSSQFGAGSQYAYYHDEDETTFQLVDSAKIPKPPHQRGRFRGNMRNNRFNNNRGRNVRGGVQVGAMTTLGGKGMKARDNRRGTNRKYGARGAPPKIRDASVTVKSDWLVVEEMDFPRLAKLSLPNVAPGEDIMCCGTLEYYDKTFDRVNVKSERPLQRVDRIFHTVTTTDDPMIRVLSKTVGTVYATDTILATIMCCTRSNYSWDIVIEKIGDKLFFDKRDNTEFDLLTVNETSEPPVDDANSLNSPRNLAIEATFINHNFSQQVLKIGPNEPKFKFDEPNPFIGDDEEAEIASVAYRYRKWNLSNGITLVARCEHDAIMTSPTGDMQFLTLKALNEWDSKVANGVEWRQKLDTQRGAVLANELRNNACKLAKWTVQALLAGSDQIKFGYVSRAHIRDSSRHVILGTQQFKPNEFATQINLSMDNAWGILRCIIDICMKQKDGKYLLLKDPNKPIIRLYDIPDNTFESDGSEESNDEADGFQPLYSGYGSGVNAVKRP